MIGASAAHCQMAKWNNIATAVTALYVFRTVASIRGAAAGISPEAPFVHEYIAVTYCLPICHTGSAVQPAAVI